MLDPIYPNLFVYRISSWFRTLRLCCAEILFPVPLMVTTDELLADGFKD